MIQMPTNIDTITGMDEVGRGALAGPILAVAATFKVTRDGTCPIKGVKDSKKFSDKQKMKEVYLAILKSPYFCDMGVGWCSVKEINEMGINPANETIFVRALADLSKAAEFLIVDGINPVDSFSYKRQYVAPQADVNHWQVGAASILAKILRDEWMESLDEDYPQFDLANNAGYGSKKHRDALLQIGPTPIHRTKFIQKILGRYT